MLALRRDVSVLIEKGHSQARLYPVIMIWNEAEICRERRRLDLLAMATIMQRVAIATNGNLTKNGQKEATQNLADMLKGINNGWFG